MKPRIFVSVASTLVVFLACSSTPKATQNYRGNYPAHWWAEISREGAPTWEILPHEAKAGEVILSKRNELGLLSNFAATPFVFHGKRFASLEGFWQSMLYPEGPSDPRAKFPGLKWPHSRADVEQMVAFDAKRAGDAAKENMKKMGIDWVSFEGKRFAYKSPTPAEHYQLIVEATREKLKQNQNVRDVLLGTGDLKLRPDHEQDPNSPPEWRYFEIYEQLREEIRSGKD
jgi:predicted NAD-dependent protein-ADP-ribosyltransferase YbiA (DUF1768 family)